MMTWKKFSTYLNLALNWYLSLYVWISWDESSAPKTNQIKSGLLFKMISSTGFNMRNQISSISKTLAAIASELLLSGVDCLMSFDSWFLRKWFTTDSTAEWLLTLFKFSRTPKIVNYAWFVLIIDSIYYIGEGGGGKLTVCVLIWILSRSFSENALLQISQGNGRSPVD